MSEKTKTDGKKGAEAASNIITVRLPASCPLFRYTLNRNFGSTASQSVPAGFQVPPEAAGGGAGAAAPGQSGASQGSALPVSQPGAGAAGQQGQPGGGGEGQQTAPPAGGDLPTHTSGQPPPPTDNPAAGGQRKRQDPNDPAAQGQGQGQGGQPTGNGGGLPVVREGEQPPPFAGDQSQGQGESQDGQAAGQAPAASPAPPAGDPTGQGGQPQTPQGASLQTPPTIPTGAETGWLGITQEAGQNSTTAKQLQGDVGQIQVLPFPITGFTPLYNESPYQLTLSGLKQTQYPWKSGTAYTQPFGPGWVTMDVTCPTTCSGSSFAFIGADITTEACPPGVQLQSVSADDADKVITYAGFAPIEKDNRVVEIRGDYKDTLSMTANANATASFKFRGTAIMVIGVTAPKLGDYCVTVDGTSTYLTSKDEIETHAVPLYFMTSLDTEQVHEVVLTSLTGAGGQTGLVLDQVNLWGPSGKTGFVGPDGNLIIPGEDTSVGGMPLADEPVGGGGGTSAGVIVGAVLGTLAAIALCWWLLNKYNKVAEAKKEEKKMNPWDEANLLSNQKNEGVYITTVAEQRYVYPGLIAHSELKK